jgi:hypothetical protein
MNNMYKEDVWCGCKERKMGAISRHVLAGGLTLLAIMFLALFGGTPQVNAEQTAQTTKQGVKMTNADVIQLVTAGLSEQVVITSIRQAPERDFDLTPTGLIALKKAGVPDAVILIMQSNETPVRPAASSDDNGPKDDTVSGIKDYLQQRVTSESRGALTLSSFSKINGYVQEITKMYVLEWQAEIQFQQEGWKRGDAFVGYWQNFGVMLQQPAGGLNNLLAVASGQGGDAKHFNEGAKIRLSGDCILRKTEQGWRTEEFTVKASQVIVESGPTEPTPSETAPAQATTEPVSFETLSETIARGETAVLKVKCNYASSGYVFLRDGVLTLSKTGIKLSLPVGEVDYGFKVSPDKILEVTQQPQHIHLRVAAMTYERKWKEVKRDFDLYNSSAVTVGVGLDGRILSYRTANIVCDGCDDTMSVLYALLEKVRNGSK